MWGSARNKRIVFHKITRAEGVIHDFAGSNYVSVDDFAFGDPHK